MDSKSLLADSGVFRALLQKNMNTWKLVKTNLLVPEDTAFISSKSGLLNDAAITELSA